jgi:hypothetical protein
MTVLKACVVCGRTAVPGTPRCPEHQVPPASRHRQQVGETTVDFSTLLTRMKVGEGWAGASRGLPGRQRRGVLLTGGPAPSVSSVAPPHLFRGVRYPFGGVR